ncbi:tryptophan-rich sensory protein [Nakamurella silvestris]|nr:tryptophan-rich sensory protein [Nakamurella silvestris]
MKIRTLLGTGLAAAVTAAAGSLAVKPDSPFYRSLKKPPFQPKPIVFPIVWTPLYADIAVTSAAALDRLAGPENQGQRRALTGALAVNLALNTGWTWLFFRARRPWVATAECALLAVSSADLARRVGQADARLGWALSPYAAWCAFATVLSGTIARMNPRSSLK